MIARVLNGGFYTGAVLVAVLMAALAAGAAAIHLYAWTVVFVSYALAMASGIARSVRMTLARERQEGVLLDRRTEARLYALVDDTARRLNVAPPDELRVTMAPNAGAAELDTGDDGGRRTALSIGLPFLVALSEEEIRVVVAHELCHLASGDSAVGRGLARARSGAAIVVGFLRHHGGWRDKPFEWYALLFLRLTARLDRRREFAADAASAYGSGPEATARTLSSIGAISEAFHVFWWFYVVDVLEAGYRPPLLDGFRRFLSAPQTTPAVNTAIERVRAASQDPYASHPSLARRLDAVGASANGEYRVPSQPAAALLRDRDVLERKALESIGDGRDTAGLEALGWADVGERALAKAWPREAAALPAEARTGTIADLPRLAAEADPAGTDALGATLACTLHVAGWRALCLPGSPFRLLNGGRHIEPFRAIRALAAGELTDEQWGELCRVWGVTDLELFVPESSPVTNGGLRARSNFVPITLLLHLSRRTRLQSAATLAAIWLLTVPLALWCIVGPLIYGAPLRGYVFFESMGIGALGLMAVLTRRERRRLQAVGSLTVDTAGLTLANPALLAQPLRVPMDDIAAIAVDDESSAWRFPVLGDHPWEDPSPTADDPVGFLWSAQARSPLPNCSVEDEVPNLVVLLRRPVEGPTVRMERKHGPFSGERLFGFFTTVSDVAATKEHLERIGFGRPIREADVARTFAKRPSGEPAPDALQPVDLGEGAEDPDEETGRNEREAGTTPAGQHELQAAVGAD